VARSKKAKQWTGVVAEPIDDIGSLMPKFYPAGSPECQEWIDRQYDRLHQLRIKKLPELARQLGIQVDKFDLTTEQGLMAFYGQLALNLAVKFEIPGFIEIKTKWPRQIVYWALLDGDARRQRGEPDPDLTSCLFMVQAFDPKLSKKGKKTAAIRRAKTLRNEVSKLRQRLKKRAAGPAAVAEFIKWLDAQASNVVELHKKKPVIS
jgi:hypothetical protein